MKCNVSQKSLLIGSIDFCLLQQIDEEHSQLQLQGVPKKIGILSSFEFLDLGGVFLGVKNNSKNFGNKKNIGLYSKILSK